MESVKPSPKSHSHETILVVDRSLNCTVSFSQLPFIENKDWKNWKDKEIEPFVVPRPGHADLVGTFKYQHDDIRLSLERASARETAIRCAIGAICHQILNQLGVEVVGYVSSIGEQRIEI